MVKLRNIFGLVGSRLKPHHLIMLVDQIMCAYVTVSPGL